MSAGGVCRKSKCHVPFVEGSHCGGRGKGNQSGFLCRAVDYTRYQGIYSSEWFWAKILHTTRTDPAIREAAWTWTEHSDWIAGMLAGNVNPDTIAHCSCAAGHKAFWHSAFGGLPSEECLGQHGQLSGRCGETV